MLKPMILLRQWLVLLMSLTLFSASSFGAHLHLCRDGQAPPSTNHLLDLVENDHTGSLSQTHDDLDVKLRQTARTGKVFKFNPPWALLNPTWSIPVVSPSEISFVVELRDPQKISTPSDLLPPLRGPPV